MISASKPSDAIHVLGDLADLEPERRDVKIELAGAMLNAGRPQDAINTLLTLHSCTPKEAPHCMGVASYAYFRMHDNEKAQTAAEQYLKYAETEDQRRNAQALLNALKRPSPSAAPAAVEREPRADLDTGGPPTLTRRTTPQPAGVTLVKGTLVEFICNGDQQTIVLETSAGRQRFLVDNPNKLLLIGLENNELNYTCGEQKPAPAIVLGFAPAPGGAGVAGLVRSLDFTK